MRYTTLTAMDKPGTLLLDNGIEVARIVCQNHQREAEEIANWANGLMPLEITDDDMSEAWQDLGENGAA